LLSRRRTTTLDRVNDGRSVDSEGESKRKCDSRIGGKISQKHDEIERGSVYSRLERDMDKKMISYETNVERVKSMNI